MGVASHSTRGMVVAADALAVSAVQGVKALIGACRQQCIRMIQHEVSPGRCLVEPVLLYVSHVWGPELFAGWRLHDEVNMKHHLTEKRVSAYLRRMVGVGRSTCIHVFLHSTSAAAPVMYNWMGDTCV
jgi:hypothetical protein